MNAPDMRAYTVFKSVMSDEPLPLEPDRGISLTPVGDSSDASLAGSATRRVGGAPTSMVRMAVALAAIFLCGLSFGFLIGVLRS